MSCVRLKTVFCIEHSSVRCSFQAPSISCALACGVFLVRTRAYISYKVFGQYYCKLVLSLNVLSQDDFLLHLMTNGFEFDLNVPRLLWCAFAVVDENKR